MSGRIAVIGEPMVELSRHPEVADAWLRGLGGDTLNTAIYLARLGTGPVAYVTRLGDDRLSDWMLERFAAEGIDTSRIVRVAGARPGLYLIETDPGGERSFSYWRSAAPARGLYDAEDNPLEELSEDGAIYLSGITLAILPPPSRERLLRRLEGAAARGAEVIFDPNHRRALWEDAATARAATEAAFGLATLVLPSREDLDLLGLSAERAAELCPGEVVVTAGGGPVLRLAKGAAEVHELDGGRSAVDTTGAGDAFNAGYIAARGAGLDAGAAIGYAARLAAIVVGHSGAILPRAAMPDPPGGAG